MGNLSSTSNQIQGTAWEACARIVEASTKSCAPTPAQSLAASEPNWDAMANSFASLSAALTWGSLILALVGILGGLAWGRFIATRAENEARTEAKKCAEEIIKRWLSEEAPGIIRAHVDTLENATLGPGDDGDAADAMGEAAG